jgi:hypothetical protein
VEEHTHHRFSNIAKVSTRGVGESNLKQGHTAVSRILFCIPSHNLVAHETPTTVSGIHPAGETITAQNLSRMRRDSKRDSWSTVEFGEQMIIAVKETKK